MENSIRRSFLLQILLHFGCYYSLVFPQYLQPAQYQLQGSPGQQFSQEPKLPESQYQQSPQQPRIQQKPQFPPPPHAPEQLQYPQPSEKLQFAQPPQQPPYPQSPEKIQFAQPPQQPPYRQPFEKPQFTQPPQEPLYSQPSEKIQFLPPPQQSQYSQPSEKIQFVQPPQQPPYRQPFGKPQFAQPSQQSQYSQTAEQIQFAQPPYPPKQPEFPQSSQQFQLSQYPQQQKFPVYEPLTQQPFRTGQVGETSSPNQTGFSKDHGEKSARAGDFPYQVQVRRNGQFLGGGTLINSPLTGKHMILTAAHVVTEVLKKSTDSISPNELSVRVGIVSRESKAGQERRVTKNIVHPGYVYSIKLGRPIFNDIAILFLEEPFVENEQVSALGLPPPDAPEEHEMVTVVRWGMGREAGHNELSHLLRYFIAPVWNSNKCNETYLKESGIDLITKKHFCAGYQDGHKDSCQGDSGGSVTGLVNEQTYLAGIVSWGKECGLPGYPGVYVRVADHLKWILQITYLVEVAGYV